MAVTDGQTTAREMKTRLREKPLSELMEEIKKLSSISDCDVDLLCAYLDVLEEKDPVLPPDRDPAAQYEKFKEDHAELFDAPERAAKQALPRKGRFPRVKKVLTALAAAFCVVVLVADASGAGVIDRLIEWGAETFSLQPASGVMELETADENGFRSLREALEYYEVEDPAIPTWIPGRYSIDKVVLLKSNDSAIVSGKYAAGDDALLIRVTIGNNEVFTFEEDHTEKHTIYSNSQMNFIISAYFEKKRATWTVDNHVYSVSGFVTESELQRMLDSIQIEG